MPPPPLILASTSPYRKMLLERLGLPFSCRAPGVDEAAIQAQARGSSPRLVAKMLATAKAEAVHAEMPEAVVIGGDQLVSFDGEILGKPGSEDAAVAQLRAMTGQTHELVTAIAVLGPIDFSRTHVDVARLSMRRLTEVQLRRYVDADRPIDCAGAYKLESRGIALFDRIECVDQSAITGIPMIALTSILIECGYEIP